MCDPPRPPGRRQERQRYDENRLLGIYGDHIKPKRQGMIRILFQNPQGIGHINGDGSMQSLKITKLKETLLKHNIDVLGLAEINKDWCMIPQKETLWQCTEGWFEHRRMGTSINGMVAPTSPIQYGGTALMVMNKVAYSVIAIEHDTKKLGRWISVLLRGKNQQTCRIICAYCPCSSSGPSSTYALQTVGLATYNNFECPRQVFWQDLHEYLTSCIQAQEKLVVMGDWNSSHEEVVQWMQQFNLQDGITTRHTPLPPPPTCKRSREQPIDAIFIQNSGQCWRGGYLAFDYLEGDHRGLWCDIPIEFLLGYNMQHPVHPKARRLKTSDPRVTKKYVSELHRLLQQNDIYPKMDHL